MIPGFETAINITEQGFLLRVSLKNKFISGSYCIEKMYKVMKEFRNGEIKKEILKSFKGKTVMADYGKFDTYIVDDVCFDKTPGNTKIPLEKGGEETMTTYYKEKYAKTIRDPQQPLLVAYLKNKLTGKNDRLVYLVPELMKLVGLDDDRPLDMNRGLTSKTKLNAHGIYYF